MAILFVEAIICHITFSAQCFASNDWQTPAQQAATLFGFQMFVISADQGCL